MAKQPSVKKQDDDDGKKQAEEQSIDQPSEGKKRLVFANKEGHRNLILDQWGKLTRIDDETAAIFYENPKFYTTTFVVGKQDQVPVELLRWADENGLDTGLIVGEEYEKVE